MKRSRSTPLTAAWRLTGRSWIGLRARAAVLLAGMLLSTANCGDDGPIIDEEQNRAAAESLGVADRQPALHVWSDADANKPVELYVDLSQSMRGFLDEEFRTDPVRYRGVIDIIDARLHPTPIYGFGSTVRVAGERALKTLGNREIYSDGNTQLEDVFPRIEADSQLAASHLIIGDGRRADPNLANDQYVRMRQLADAWIRRGGTFAVAASQAPFRPVASDPSGCRAREERRTGDDREGEATDSVAGTCPLYAFAFIAPGDENRVANALAERFEHLFVMPAPAVDERAVAFRVIKPIEGITLDPAWVERPALGHVARSRGVMEPVNSVDSLEAEIVLSDADSPDRRGRTAALVGQGVRAVLYARRLHALEGEIWQQVTGADDLVGPGKDPFHWRFVTVGPEAERIAYRIELVPTGTPGWLGGFDAESANDALRTYGLGRLFQGFAGTRAAPVLRAYVVAN